MGQEAHLHLLFLWVFREWPLWNSTGESRLPAGEPPGPSLHPAGFVSLLQSLFVSGGTHTHARTHAQHMHAHTHARAYTHVWAMLIVLHCLSSLVSQVLRSASRFLQAAIAPPWSFPPRPLVQTSLGIACS